MRLLKIVFLLLFFCGLNAHAQQQPSDTAIKEYFLVKKNDGAEYVGEVISDDGREILLLTKNIGKLYINKSEIASLTKIDPTKLKVSKDGVYEDYRLEGPYTTRYFFTTNALPIKKDENYMMIGLQGPEVHVAVSDNLSLGVMATWIASPLALAAKYSFDAESEDDVHFAVGTILATSGYLMQGQGVGGIHWLTATKGDRSSNISLSAGYAYAYTGDRFSNYYGEKYSVISNHVSPYDASRALFEQNLLDGEYYDNYLYDDNRLRGSYVLGISGITPIGKKSSLIIDVLSFIGTSYDSEAAGNRTFNNVSYEYYGWNNGQSGYHDVTEDITVQENQLVKTGLRPHVIIMPAMRFNQSYNKAFQVALAGVITTQTSGDVIAFPIPTLSWLRQF